MLRSVPVHFGNKHVENCPVSLCLEPLFDSFSGNFSQNWTSNGLFLTKTRVLMRIYLNIIKLIGYEFQDGPELMSQRGRVRILAGRLI